MPPSAGSAGTRSTPEPGGAIGSVTRGRDVPPQQPGGRLSSLCPGWLGTDGFHRTTARQRHLSGAEPVGAWGGRYLGWGGGGGVMQLYYAS